MSGPYPFSDPAFHDDDNVQEMLEAWLREDVGESDRPFL